MLKKLFTWLILPVAIVALVYAIVSCIMQPVKFNKETAIYNILINKLKEENQEINYQAIENRLLENINFNSNNQKEKSQRFKK